MSNSSHAASQPCEYVDPFLFIVTDDGESTTLLDVMTKIVFVSLTELRQLNPSLAHITANSPLPKGTRVRLPVKVAQRVCGVGLPFTLGDEESRLRQCENRLDGLLAAYEMSPLAGPLPQPPCRHVHSATEQIVAAMHSEAARQLPVLEKAYHELGKKDPLIHHLVDIREVQRTAASAAAQFAPSRVPLECYKEQHMALMSQQIASSRSIPENFLTSADLHTVTDSSEDFCVEHTHRWEFSFCAPNSTEIQDGWAVLSCQVLTSLLDAFQCRSMLPLLAPASRNAFLFMGGVFYIDDRHQGEADYEDLSALIRNFDPLLHTAKPHEHHLDESAHHRRELGDGVTSDTRDTHLHDSSPSVFSPTRGHAGDTTDNMDDDASKDEGNAGSREQQRCPTRGINLGYGRCPVRSASKTTFAEVRLTMHDMCVLRHLGECNHYFYLSGVRRLRESGGVTVALNAINFRTG